MSGRSNRTTKNYNLITANRKKGTGYVKVERATKQVTHTKKGRKGYLRRKKKSAKRNREMVE